MLAADNLHKNNKKQNNFIPNCSLYVTYSTHLSTSRSSSW